MRFSIKHLSLAIFGLASAESICDKYTTALLKENNATNQLKLITLVVNTAVIGNYTKPNVGIKVPGILAAAKYNNTDVNLAQYFSGALESTNNGSKSGVSVNFLDDGGATPLQLNKPANGTSSNQYKLLTHLYEFFGAVLNCSQYGKSGFSSYSGDTSMYEVHKFMALDAFEVGYFIQQVGMSAASFGVSDSDAATVGNTLNAVFGHKCAAAAAVLPSAKEELQAICIADDCPVATNASCKSYDPVVKPTNTTANGTSTTSASAAGATSTSNGVQLTSHLGLVIALLCIAMVGIPPFG
ncbi:hypothetical protein NA57DRAFT_55876 [Rhizodiscina lignyota]|uniref:Secreted protein n=1 Tax=Rhizodiscina lignyota TaxID=1504668 RepID=A0A9P4IFE6_9PEZI|nr:hypothetical protein NA57DRAFT_55876 [Rhizodiscina lignyota]